MTDRHGANADGQSAIAGNSLLTSIRMPPDVRRVATRLRGVAPLVVFGALEGVAFGLWMFAGRFQWFHHDEWDFIASRTAGNLGDLFRPHSAHWVTVPVLLYRLLFWLFGLRAYLPYRLPVLASHLAAAALLVIVMRRAGVRPWIATAAGSLFLFLGAGAQDITDPFQVCFTASLAFGLAHLLFADHDGPVGRRDGFGLLAGLIGLMCSGVAISMTAIVGVAVLFRRGWRIALLQTMPLAACYLVWLLAIGHRQPKPTGVTFGGMLRFVEKGLGATYRSIVHYGWLGVALEIVLVVGLLLSLTEHRRSQRLSQLAAPVALLIGSIVFLLITSIGRVVYGVNGAGSSRFVYIVVAMTLPALAVAADALASQWRPLLPVAIAIFLVGVPGNIRLGIPPSGRRTSYTQTRRMILSLPRVAIARDVPRSIRPEPVITRPVTIGWLLDGVADHRIPSPGALSRSEVADAEFRLSFAQQHGRLPTASCHTVIRPLVVQLREGDVIGVYGNTVLLTPNRVFAGPPLVLFPGDREPLDVVHTPGAVRFSQGGIPLNFRMVTDNTHRPPRVCLGK